MTPLDQLRRAVRLRSENWGVLNDCGRLLFGRVIFARYIDCRAAGQGREALRVLEGTR